MTRRPEDHARAIVMPRAECAARSSPPRYASVSTMMPGRAPVHQDLAEQFARHLHRGAVVERARQNAAPRGCAIPFDNYHRANATVHRNRSTPDVVTNLEELLRSPQAHRANQLEPAGESAHHHQIHRRVARGAPGGIEGGARRSLPGRARHSDRHPPSSASFRIRIRRACSGRGFDGGDGSGGPRARYRTALAALGVASEDRRLFAAPDAGAHQDAGTSSRHCCRPSPQLPSLDFGSFTADRFFLYQQPDRSFGFRVH